MSPSWQSVQIQYEHTIVMVDFCEKDKRFENLDLDDGMLGRFINMRQLKKEYDDVKSLTIQKAKEKELENKRKNAFTDVFKNSFNSYDMIDAELSKQEIVVKMYSKKNCAPDCLLTSGRLYYDGSILRCEGSPFNCCKIDYEINDNGGGYNSVKKQFCVQDRKYSTEAELLNSGELTITMFDKIKNEQYPNWIDKKVRYLYVTTFQNDNFKFTEREYDIDAILKKLDDNLTV